MQAFQFGYRFCLALAIGLAFGCGPGGPEVGEVEGTVLLGGEPLEGALVMFTPADGGRPAAARTDAEGHYELLYTQGRTGALLGEHTVTISTFQEADPGAGVPSIPEKVPAKYNVNTELRETVDIEGSVINFDLDEKGEIIEPTLN